MCQSYSDKKNHQTEKNTEEGTPHCQIRPQRNKIVVTQWLIFPISIDLNELNDKDNEVNKMRVKRGFKARRRRKRVLKLAKGFRGGRSKLFRTAADAVDKALMYSYRDRRTRKRDFRQLWIARINAAARLNNLSYSKFIHGLKLARVELDRKVLAELAISDPTGFKRIANLATQQL
jgi:large subunit ribosomal protein L20